MTDEVPALSAILRCRERVPPGRSSLVAISGIDGAGKGWLTDRLTAAMERRGLRVARITVDGWLNLPHVRFDAARPAETFYERALRLDEMFRDLVLPLRENRSCRVVSDFAEETATAYRPHTWVFENVDVILLEGIYLLKRALARRYDLSLWVECSFETAMERALGRAQEGLSLEATRRAYETIYFPAQRIHFERDAPRETASRIVVNDPRLEATTSSRSP